MTTRSTFFLQLITTSLSPIAIALAALHLWSAMTVVLLILFCVTAWLMMSILDDEKNFRHTQTP